MVLHAPTAPRVGLESILRAVAGLCCIHSSQALASQAGCHAGNGLKTGYISASAASVWSRLTLAPEANWAGTPWLKHAPPALCALSAGCAAEAQMPKVRRVLPIYVVVARPQTNFHRHQRSLTASADLWITLPSIRRRFSLPGRYRWPERDAGCATRAGSGGFGRCGRRIKRRDCFQRAVGADGGSDRLHRAMAGGGSHGRHTVQCHNIVSRRFGGAGISGG